VSLRARRAIRQAQQTITVEAEVSQVDTQSTAVGALVEGAQIRDLPLNGRNFTQLMRRIATVGPGLPARQSIQ
jgi:hypothetical protein